MGFSLITSDGTTYALTDVDIINTAQGLWLPPLEHSWKRHPFSDGGTLASIRAAPRTVTIRATVAGTSETALVTKLGNLAGYLRHNRTPTPQPCRLRYTLGSSSADLYCYLAGGTVKDDGGWTRTIEVSLVAYDPYWYATSDTTGYLDPQDVDTVRLVIERASNGSWDVMPPPAAGGVYNSIRALLYDPGTAYLWIGGNFTNWNGDADADYIAVYDAANQVYKSLGVAGADGVVYALALAPDGKIYAGGAFTNIGGVAASRIAVWDGEAWSALGAGVNNTVYAITVAPDGTVYAGGSFTTAGGGAANYIAAWDGSAWSALGAGVDSFVLALHFNYDYSLLYVGGNFTNAGGSSAKRIATWDGTSWAATDDNGMDNIVRTIECGPDGRIYAGGDFTTAGGTTANRVAVWDGAAWTALGDGMNVSVYALKAGPDGWLWAAGAFTTAGGIALADRIARWNGYTWAHVPVDLPGTPIAYAIEYAYPGGTYGGEGDPVWEYDLWFGFDTTGSALIPGTTTVGAPGTVEAYPVITVYGPGTLQSISAEHNRFEIVADLYVSWRESVTFDLRPGYKTAISSWRGNVLGDVYPASDLMSFSFLPVPPGDSPTGGPVLVFISGQPIEAGDEEDQLSGWENITGLTLDNTDYGRLYISIISVGGGFYCVGFYSDSDRTALVAHTGNYNLPGTKTVYDDDDSGIGGTITVDAVVGADNDITITYALVTYRYSKRYYTLEDAIT